MIIPCVAQARHPDPGSPRHPSTCTGVQVGGLADVVTGLSKATAARGHSVEVVLPYYAFLEGSPDVRDARSVGVFNVPKVW